jgi:hypothetical protein
MTALPLVEPLIVDNLAGSCRDEKVDRLPRQDHAAPWSRIWWRSASIYHCAALVGRHLEIPEDMQKKYGFAPLGDANSGAWGLIT